MKRKGYLHLPVFLGLLCMLLCTALSVHAANDEAILGQLEQESSVFLSTVYEMPDDQLELLRENGGFYEVFVRSWYEDREIVGAFRGISEAKAESGEDGQIVIDSVVEFEKYTSDVQIYYDTEKMLPVNYVMNIRYSMAEKMTQAAQNMAVGLIVVFVVLVFLMFIISLFRFIAPKQKKEAPQQAAAATAPAAAVPETAPAAAPENAAALEEEIAAVIAAAIAAASAEAPSASGYVVRSVRRRKHSDWKRV